MWVASAACCRKQSSSKDMHERLDSLDLLEVGDMSASDTQRQQHANGEALHENIT